MYKFLPKFLYSPEDNGGGTPDTGTKESLNANDILKLMSEDDESEEDIPLEPTKKESESPEETEESEVDSEELDEEDKEVKELEEELDNEIEPDDEKLELIDERASRKEILKAYPDIFKKFPSLEKSIYREQAYSKIFPSIDDAKSAQESTDIIQKVDSDLREGNLKNIISIIKGNKPAFNKMVDNYLPLLYETDKDAYFHVVGNTVKQTVQNLVNAAKETDDEETQTSLMQTARGLYKFVFNSTKWEAPTSLSSDDDTNPSEESKISKERESLRNERYQAAKSDIESSLERSFKKTIEKHIDPKRVMSDYVKRTAVRDAYEQLTSLIDKDPNYKRVLLKSWQVAANSNFSKDALAKIKENSVNLSRAKLALAIKKARVEALKGIGKRVKAEKDDTEEETDPPTKRSVGKTKTDSPKSSKSTIPPGMSVTDFIMKD